MSQELFREIAAELREKMAQTEKTMWESKKFCFAFLMAVILGIPLWFGVFVNWWVYDASGVFQPVMTPNVEMGLIGALTTLFTTYLSGQSYVDARQRQAQADMASRVMTQPATPSGPYDSINPSAHAPE